MLSAAKVTEIYCMTDDFAGNLCCTLIPQHYYKIFFLST